MIALIKNEGIKLLRKRSFYVVTFVFILFCILTNILYRTPIEITEDSPSILDLEEENLGLDLNDSEELVIYVENLTQIKIEELKEEYGNHEVNYIIENFLYNPIYRLFESKYIYEDENLSEVYRFEVEEDIAHIQNHDVKYFLEQRIAYLTDKVENTKGIECERYQTLLNYALYREGEEVYYDEDHYLHDSLVFLEENTYEYINLLHRDHLTSEEEKRLNYLDKQMSIHEYVIDTQQDLLNDHTLRAVLINFSSEFGIFILIYVIMLAGSLVSEEYTRGTIKYLFTKPFKRRTILTSKLLILLLFIPLIVLFLVLIEMIVGGVILGFDSLSIPVIIWDDGIKTFPVLAYLANLLVLGLPMYLVIGILTFMVSTISASTSAAITIGFLFYLLGNVIANIALTYDFKIFRACVSLYWDFSYILTGGTSPYGNDLLTSLFVILLYIIVMICITYVIFLKKDVKNLS